MLFERQTILSAFSGLHSWEQPYDPEADRIFLFDEGTTGIKYNSENPLLNYENLRGHCPDRSMITPAEYAGGTQYSPGDFVTYSTNIYKALKTVQGVTPDTLGENWVQTNFFSEWLKEQTDAAILKAVEAWYLQKMDRHTLGTVLDDVREYNTGGSYQNTIENDGSVVGREFSFINSKTAVLYFRKVGLQFTENQDITLYLWNANNAGAIQSKTLTYSGGGSVQFFELDWKVRSPGVYFIGYLQEDISGTAINGAVNYSYPFAGVTMFPLGKFFRAVSFKNDPVGQLSGVFLQVGVTEIQPVQPIFDVKQMKYSHETNFGLNFEVSVYCDFTDLIVSWKDSFASMIRKAVAVHFLEIFMSNPNTRTNKRERNLTVDRIRYELDGDDFNKGLRKRLESEIKMMSFDRTGVDKFCLPCQKRGVKHTIT
jgi:hypothetical protein